MISGERMQLSLEGEYDLSRREELAMLFASCDGTSEVVIDLAHVTYIDSTFLHELVTFRNRDTQRTISVVGVCPQIRRVLDIVQYDKIFEIHD